MLCGSGRTYVVNEYVDRHKKDKSFQSIIASLFLVLLAFGAVYYGMSSISKKARDILSELEITAAGKSNANAGTRHSEEFSSDNNPSASTYETLTINQKVSYTTVSQFLLGLNTYFSNTNDREIKTSKDTSSTQISTSSYDISNNINTIGYVEMKDTEIKTTTKDTLSIEISTSSIHISKNTNLIIVDDADSTASSQNEDITTEDLIVSEYKTPNYDAITMTYILLNYAATAGENEQDSNANHEYISAEENIDGLTSAKIHDLSSNSIADIVSTESNENTMSPNTSLSFEANQSVAKIPDYTTKSTSLNKEQICSSPICKSKASNVLQQMDHSKDPCETFYEFSCGGFENTQAKDAKQINFLLEYVYRIDKGDGMDIQRKIFMDFFDSCVKYYSENGSSRKLKQALTTDNQLKNLTELFTSLMLKDSAPLFVVRNGVVDGHYVLHLFPPTDSLNILEKWSLESHVRKECFELRDNFKFEEKVKLKQLHDEYNECQYKILRRMVENFQTLAQHGSNHTMDIEYMMDFLLNKKKVSDIDIHNAILHRDWFKTDIAALNADNNYNFIDWTVLLAHFVDDSSSNIDLSSPVVLYMKENYFDVVMKDLKNRLLQNEKAVSSALEFYFQLQVYEYLMEYHSNRDQFCMRQATQLMPQIADEVFLEIYPITPKETAYLEEKFEELKTDFFELIDASNLEANDKKDFMENYLKKLKLNLGYKSEKKVLENNYRSWEEDYLTKLFELLEISVRGTFRFQSMRTVNPSNDFYYPKLSIENNTIVVPYIFINNYLKRTGYPGYVREVYIKFYLSNAIASSLQELSRISTSFFNQLLEALGNYLEDFASGLCWKGQKIIINDNRRSWAKSEFLKLNIMAEGLAIDIAFNSFRKYINLQKLPWISEEYSAEKQFFILVAQEFCEYPTLAVLAHNLYNTLNMPSVFKLDAVLANSKNFAAAFQCPQGIRMNPENKVEFQTFKTMDYDLNYIYGDSFPLS